MLGPWCWWACVRHISVGLDNTGAKGENLTLLSLPFAAFLPPSLPPLREKVPDQSITVMTRIVRA